jgi:cation transport ATPase
MTGECPRRPDADTQSEQRNAATGASLRLAGALEHASEHPSKAVSAAVRAKVGELPAVREFRNTEGLGVSGIVDGTRSSPAAPKLLAERGVQPPDELARAVLVVADTVKPTSAPASCGRWACARCCSPATTRSPRPRWASTRFSCRRISSRGSPAGR